MNVLDSLRLQLQYSDEMNRRIMTASNTIDSDKLDDGFDMGLGTLRKTLLHIYVAEKIWLERWKANGEVPWPPYETSQTPAEILAECETVWASRDRFLETVDDVKLFAEQMYRDSKGSRFQATLHEMILQGINHSVHHRAQAVNMIRRLGGPGIEVDFMYWRRRPV